jgi:hypothetical protein
VIVIVLAGSWPATTAAVTAVSTIAQDVTNDDRRSLAHL